MSTKRTSVDTRYKKVSTLKEGDYLQIGQYKRVAGKLSRLLHKEGTDTFLHGKAVDNRFLRAHYAKRQGVLIPSEPQQAKMLTKDIASRHLGALSRILATALDERMEKMLSQERQA